MGAACFLFGVVWRYAVRTDVDDSNLKSGVVAAFGIVRGSGLAQGEITQVGRNDVATIDRSIDRLPLPVAGTTVRALNHQWW